MLRPTLLLLASLALSCDPRDRRVGPAVRRGLARTPAPAGTALLNGADDWMEVVHATGSGDATRLFVFARSTAAAPIALRAVVQAHGRVLRVAADAPAEGFLLQALVSHGWVFLTPLGRVFGSDTFAGRLRALGALGCGASLKRGSAGRAVLRASDGALYSTDGRRPLARLTAPSETLDVAFDDDARGAAVVEGGALYRTDDGGATWRRVGAFVSSSVESRGDGLVVTVDGLRRGLARDGSLAGDGPSCSDAMCGEDCHSLWPGMPRNVGCLSMEFLTGDANLPWRNRGAPSPPSLRGRRGEVLASSAPACSRGPADRSAVEIDVPLRIRSVYCTLRATRPSPLRREAGEGSAVLSTNPPVLERQYEPPPDATTRSVAWSDQDARGRFGVWVPRTSDLPPGCSAAGVEWATRTGALAGACFIAADGAVTPLRGWPRNSAYHSVARLRDGRAASHEATTWQPWTGALPTPGSYSIAHRFVVDGRGQVSEAADHVSRRALGNLWVELPDGRSGPARFVGSDPDRLEALILGEREPRELLRVDGQLEAAPCASDAPAPDAVTVHLTSLTYAELVGESEQSDGEGDTRPFADEAAAVVEMTARSACVRSIAARIYPAGEDQAVTLVTARRGVLAGFADTGERLYAITCRR